jgi:hypothetical protein
MSESHKGQIAHNKGKPNSEEQNRKVSKALKGVPWSEVRRAAQKEKSNRK